MGPANEVQALLQADSSLGILGGLETFTQLVYALRVPRVGEMAVKYIPGLPVRILDKPAFPHRGFMLDTSRHFFPLADVERTLDTMASVKLNVLHWHATDSQSWPLFTPALPKLHKAAAYSPQETYSHADILHL